MNPLYKSEEYIKDIQNAIKQVQGFERLSNKSVLITTMHRGNNFGSALQIYALVNALKGLNIFPIVLDYIPERIVFSKVLKSLLRGIFSSSIHHRYQAFRGLCILLSNTFYYGLFFRRELSMTKSYYSIEEIEKANLHADVYMTGSDQVWNSTHNQGIDRVFFLDFLPKDSKRVAYAASFGYLKSDVDDFVNDLVDDVKDGLNEAGKKAGAIWDDIATDFKKGYEDATKDLEEEIEEEIDELTEE